MTENTTLSFNSPILGSAVTDVVESYVPYLRGGGNDSVDSDSGYEADSEKNDSESADEASDDERSSSSGRQSSTAADHWDDSDGDSDNCYTSDNGNSS